MTQPRSCYCRVCGKAREAYVCGGCVRLNVNAFLAKRGEACTHVGSWAARVADAAGGEGVRVGSVRREMSFRLGNIGREAAYTRSLAAEAQKTLDDLRDKVNRRRSTLDHAKSELDESASTALTKLRSHTRTRRRQWKEIAERIQQRRRQLLVQALDFYSLRPAITAPEAAALSADAKSGLLAGKAYRVGAVPVPSLLRIKDYPSEVTGAAMTTVARLVRSLAQYLGVHLPHAIRLPAADHPACTLLHGGKFAETPLKLDGKDDIEGFATAAAMLLADTRHLVSTQQIDPLADEFNPARILAQLASSGALIGHLTDDCARYPTRDLDRPRLESVSKLAAKIVDEYAAEQWEKITVPIASTVHLGQFGEAEDEPD
ncbi:hypothetical protein PYCC9005_002927 [Savitreella phatthalungensis]